MINDESDKVESTEKKELSKAMALIESFALFQNDDITKQL